MTHKEALNRLAMIAQTYFEKDTDSYEHLRQRATEIVKLWKTSTLRFNGKNYGIVIHDAEMKTIRDKKMFIQYKCDVTRGGQIALQNGEFGVDIRPGWLFTNHVKVYGVTETAEGMKVKAAVMQGFMEWYASGDITI